MCSFGLTAYSLLQADQNPYQSDVKVVEIAAIIWPHEERYNMAAAAAREAVYSCINVVMSTASLSSFSMLSCLARMSSGFATSCEMLR